MKCFDLHRLLLSKATKFQIYFKMSQVDLLSSKPQIEVSVAPYVSSFSKMKNQMVAFSRLFSEGPVVVEAHHTSLESS